MQKEKTVIQELIEWIEEMENSPISLTFSEIDFKTLSQFKDKISSKLEKEKKMIINAVNEHDEKCVTDGNKITNFIKKGAGCIFEYTGEEGEKYYNEKFIK